MGFFIGGKWNSPRPTEDFSDFYNPDLGIGEFEFIKPPIDGFKESLMNIFYPTETEFKKQFLVTYNKLDTQLSSFADVNHITQIPIDNINGYVYAYQLPSSTVEINIMNEVKKKSSAEWLTNPDKFPLSTRLVYEGKYLILRDLPLVKLIVDIDDLADVTRKYGDVFTIQTYDKGYVNSNGVYFIPAFTRFYTISKYIGIPGKNIGNLELVFNKKPNLNISKLINHFNLREPILSVGTFEFPSSANGVAFDSADCYDTDITIRGRLLAD